MKLNKIVGDNHVEIFVKCEHMNPGGSIKDRTALSMIQEAIKSGELKKGGTIVEQSTGNTGPALSFVGGVLGYDVKLFLPSNLGGSYNPIDRIRMAQMYGCEVEEVDVKDHFPRINKLDGSEKAAAMVLTRMKLCHELAHQNEGYWWSDQLRNPNNTKSHRLHTGREIIDQMEGHIDAWVASVGTGGTLLGVAQAIREVKPMAKVAGVFPSDDARMDWMRSGIAHSLLEEMNVPPRRFIMDEILTDHILDHEIVVDNKDAKMMTDRLASEEGILCGMSSGANVHAAIQLSKSMAKGSRIVTVIVDRRDRYFAEYPNEQYVV